MPSRFSEEMLFDPVEGGVSGVIDGVQDFDSEFGEQAGRLRDSAIADL